MTDRSKKITELTAASSAVANDVLIAVTNTSSNAVTKKITVGAFFSNVVANTKFSNTVTFGSNTAFSGTISVGGNTVIAANGAWVGNNSGLKGETGSKGDKGEVGSKGEKGQKGEYGEKGEVGATGSKGDTGTTGSSGDKGDKGEVGVTGATGSSGDKGDKGEVGVTGATGSKGDTGTTGSSGSKGDKGEVGVTGTKGDTGTTGDKGDKGDKGDTGTTGAVGAVGGFFFYTFDTSKTTDTAPTSQSFHCDNPSSQGSITKIWLDNEDTAGADVSSFITTVFNTTGTPKGFISLRGSAGTERWYLQVDSVTAKAGYYEIAVTPLATPADAIDNGDLTGFNISRNGDSGSKGDSGNKGDKGDTGPNLTTTKFGYSSGGSVTQSGTRGSGVTLNALSGTLTLVSATMTAGQVDAIAMNNSAATAGDIIVCTTYGGSAGTYLPMAYCSLDGLIMFTLRNLESYTTGSEAPVIKFIIIKAATS